MPGALRKIKIKQAAQTTLPGYKSKHGQVVVRDTHFPSKSFPGQHIYELLCDHCKHRYGANGCDIHLRRCPSHQNGTPGEPLREASASLFAEAI